MDKNEIEQNLHLFCDVIEKKREIQDTVLTVVGGGGAPVTPVFCGGIH